MLVGGVIHPDLPQASACSHTQAPNRFNRQCVNQEIGSVPIAATYNSLAIGCVAGAPRPGPSRNLGGAILNQQSKTARKPPYKTESVRANSMLANSVFMGDEHLHRAMARWQCSPMRRRRKRKGLRLRRTSADWKSSPPLRKGPATMKLLKELRQVVGMYAQGAEERLSR